MSKRDSRSKRVNWLTFTLVFAAVALLSVVSVQERHGADVGLPVLSELEFIQDLFGGASVSEPSAPNAKGAGSISGDGVTVHFIDVGQGKAILIEAPEKSVLIDAGENNQGQKLLRYFSSHNVKQIDIAIGTHPHADHIGGMDVVIDGIPVDNVILPVLPDAITPATATYTSLLASIANAGLKITPAKAGDSFDLGGGARLALLGPVVEYDDLNSSSVVSKLDYGDTSFLFTGDATAISERDLLEADKNLRASVLDVAHHGSSTSTQARFLKAVMPDIAVISCGIDNVYGHPHREIVERLGEFEAKILRTDLDGTVIIFSDGKSLGVQTEK